MNTTRVTPSPCPFCGYVCDAATGVRDAVDDAPTAADSVTVCVSCASILFFNDDLTLRAPRPGEIEALKSQATDIYDLVWRAQQEVRRIDRTRLAGGKPGRSRGRRP